MNWDQWNSVLLWETTNLNLTVNYIGKYANNWLCSKCQGIKLNKYWEQSWYKHQASGPPMWCKPRDGYLYPTWRCYYPYHLQNVQGLPPWERFCRWFVQQVVTIMGFLFRSSSPMKQSLASLRVEIFEISNFYNLSARLLVFNTHIPPIINTYTSKFRSCLSDTFWIIIFSFLKKGLFSKSISSDKFKV